MGQWLKLAEHSDNLEFWTLNSQGIWPPEENCMKAQNFR